MKKIFSNFKGDRVIWIVVVMLLLFSLLSVYSSSGVLAFKNKAGNTEYYLIKQAMFLLFGFALMYITHLIKYTYYSRISQIILVVSIPLLILTLFMGSINDASRWLYVPGTSITFQSSDLAKLALIMYVARMLTLKQGNITDFKEAFLPVLMPILVVCGLILPANFSTAAILFATCLVLMFIGRIKLKFIISLIGIGVLCFSVYILIAINSNSKGRIGTWKHRIERFTKNAPEENEVGNYQVEQAKIAIATGGIFGKKPGRSTQRYYLPHPYSDFIFAFIIEEYGLVGGTGIVFLYLILLYRGVRIATKTQSTFGMLLAIGCCLSLIFQTLINMAVAVNLLPVTGQPLPLVSMGGTSILFTSISVGIILSISREIEEEKQNKVETEQIEANAGVE